MSDFAGSIADLDGIPIARHLDKAYNCKTVWHRVNGSTSSVNARPYECYELTFKDEKSLAWFLLNYPVGCMCDQPTSSGHFSLDIVGDGVVL